MLSQIDQIFLLQLSRHTLEYFFETHNKLSMDTISIQSKILLEKRGVFVTLTKKGDLRGCIGNLEPIQTIVESVIDNTLAAAFYDFRFTPLDRSELKDIKIEISILDSPQKLNIQKPQEIVKFLEQNRPGVILENRYYKATFLPQVWEEINSAQEFLESLSIKAGLNKDAWKDMNTTLLIYNVQAFKEK